MNHLRGKLIVIEGVDAVGKATQTELLVKRLKRSRCPVHSISFPQYGHRSAKLVENYLHGTFGPAAYVSPFLAAVFYLTDQISARARLARWLRAGDWVVADRYVPSNVAFQSAKIKNKKARATFVHWLEDFSYITSALPKPDCVILLDIPSLVRERLLARRAGKKDGHERAHAYLRRVANVYHYLAKAEHWRTIACTRSGRMRPREGIANDVVRVVNSLQ